MLSNYEQKSREYFVEFDEDNSTKEFEFYRKINLITKLIRVKTNGFILFYPH